MHRAAGPGIQVVVYDGALRGVHIDHIMRTLGYVVLAKQATSTPDPDTQQPITQMVMTPNGTRARSYPLGNASHDLPTGPCQHQLATIAGQVVEVGLDEAGDPVVVSTLDRGQVKRVRRATGQFHFNVAYTLHCPIEPFTIWLSPHAGTDPDSRRPENLRIIPASDPDAQRLQGIRSDAESFHSHYKRTLIADRAMSLGAHRGLVDLYCFALYNTALTEHRHQTRTTTARPHPLAADPPTAPALGN